MPERKTHSAYFNYNARYLVGLLLLTALFSVNCVHAQNAKAASDLFESGNYFESIKNYTKLLEKDDNNGLYHYRLGISYLRTNVDPMEALDHLIAAEKLGVNEKDLSFEIGSAYMFHLEYDEAIVHFEKFKAEGKVNKKNADQFERSMANAKTALDLIKYPVEVSFKNLGENINSAYPDYHPFTTADGNRMVYTSRRKVRPGSNPEFDGYYPSDIYVANKVANNWGESDRLNDRINTIYDEQTVGLSASGDTLFYYIDHVEDFGDIFSSVFKNNEYTNPLRMPAYLNSPQVESAASISGDGNTLVFSTNRPGGEGDLDIWISRKDLVGNWSEAKSLGNVVNTPAREDYPSLSHDGLILYYCSEGHAGMGGFDLFFSCFDTLTQLWTKPQNMGYPINTPGDERTISFEQGGLNALIAALREEGYGDLDIYELSYTTVPVEDEPAIFHLQINADANSLGALEITINNAFDVTIGKYRPNIITGRFTIALHPGTYYIYCDAEGYLPYTEVWVVNEAHKRQSSNVKMMNLLKK